MNIEVEGVTRRGDVGQAVVFVVVVLLIVAVVATVLAENGAAVAKRSQAQSIADLAALAVVVHGDAGAAAVAAENRASVVSVSPQGEATEVVIAWEGIVATARAGPGTHP